MQRGIYLFITGCIALSILLADIGESRRNSIVKAVEEISPAVVSLSLIKRRERRYLSIEDYFDSFFFRRPPEYTVQEEIIHLPKVGSGFIIDSEGYILTNSHIIQNAEKVEVTLPDGRVFDGELMGIDSLTDICLLKINGENLPYARLGDSDDIYIGEWSIALGNPYGPAIESPEPTVTVGVISGVNRNFQSRRDNRLYRNMIQTDASINPGNSGGPLVNAEGLVIGINTFIITRSGGSEGIGFAIPINQAKDIMELLKEYGKVERPTLSFNIQEVTEEIAGILQFEQQGGALINYVHPQSIEARKNLQRGDIITQINGEEVQGAEHFRALVMDIKVGTEVTFQIFRNGNFVEITIQY